MLAAAARHEWRADRALASLAIAGRDFPHRPAKFRGSHCLAAANPEKRQDFLRSLQFGLAQLLPLRVASITCFE